MQKMVLLKKIKIREIKMMKDGKQYQRRMKNENEIEIKGITYFKIVVAIIIVVERMCIGHLIIEIKSNT